MNRLAWRPGGYQRPLSPLRRVGGLGIRYSPLDRLFSRYIRLRDKCCQRCGRAGGRLEAAHMDVLEAFLALREAQREQLRELIARQRSHEPKQDECYNGADWALHQLLDRLAAIRTPEAQE